MKRILLTLIVVSSLSSGLLVAQSVPGYVGKRFSLDYNLFTFLSLANPSSAEIKDKEQLDQYDVTSGSLGINIQSHIYGQWVWTKRRSMIASVAFTKSYFSPSGASYEITATTFPTMNAVAFDIGIRNYRQHFSPLGGYFEMRVGFAKVTAGDFSYHYVLDGQPDTLGVISGSSGITPQASVGWGVNRVLKDRFIISYGIDFTLPLIGIAHLPLFGGVLDNDYNNQYIDYYFGNTSDNQKALRRQAMGRYAAQSMINFKVGIGILL